MNLLFVDRTLHELACLKSEYTDYLKEQARDLLEGTDPSIPELKRFIENAKTLQQPIGKPCLEAEIQKVEHKIELMTRIINLSEQNGNSDQAKENYLDQIQSLMT